MTNNFLSTRRLSLKTKLWQTVRNPQSGTDPCLPGVCVCVCNTTPALSLHHPGASQGTAPVPWLFEAQTAQRSLKLSNSYYREKKLSRMRVDKAKQRCLVVNWLTAAMI